MKCRIHYEWLFTMNVISAYLNKHVLSNFLKMSRLTHICRLSRSWLHLVGPYVLKALLANVFLFVIGISSKLCLVFDIRHSLLFSFLMISSGRYFRVCLFSDLILSWNILKSILCCIGNQCNSLRHCVVPFLDLSFKMIFFLQCFVYVALHLLTFWKACKNGITRSLD